MCWGEDEARLVAITGDSTEVLQASDVLCVWADSALLPSDGVTENALPTGSEEASATYSLSDDLVTLA